MSEIQFSDIKKTCQSYKVSIGKMPEDAQELPKLGELKKFSSMLLIMKKAVDETKAIGQTLSPKGLKIYVSVKVQEKSATLKIIKTFEESIKHIDSLSRRKRNALSADREKFQKMLGIMRKAASKTSTIGRTLSKAALKVYLEASSRVKEASATAKVLKILQKAADDWSKKLSPKTKKGLVLYAGWTQKIDGNLLTKIDEYSKGICKAGVVLKSSASKPAVTKPKIVKPKKPEKKVEEKKSWPDYFWVKLESGYSGGEEGVFTDKPRGILFNAGAGAAFDVTKKLTLGINYLFGGPYDATDGGDKVVYDYDDARAYLTWTNKDLNLKISGALGFKRLRNDYPTIINPNLYAATQDVAAQWRFAQRFSGNLAINFEEGKAEAREETGYFKFAALPGAKLYLLDDKLVPRAGVLLSYNNVIDGLTWGIWGGGKYDLGKVEIGLDLKFTDYPGSDQYVEEWRFDGKAQLKIPVWKNLKISVIGGGFVGGTNESSAKGWEAGAGIIWEGVKNDI
jgi:hypothetical protein